MAVAAVGRVVQFGEAGVARGNVARGVHVESAGRAGHVDVETGHILRLCVSNREVPDARERRRVIPEPAKKVADVRRLSLCEDLDPACEVAHAAGDREFAREPVDKGAEADPLHRARYPDLGAPLVRDPAGTP